MHVCAHAPHAGMPTFSSRAVQHASWNAPCQLYMDAAPVHLRCFVKLWRPASGCSLYQMNSTKAEQRQQEAVCLTSAAKFCTMSQCLKPSFPKLFPSMLIHQVDQYDVIVSVQYPSG